MQRLLQGDVGSGKTIVAAIACLAPWIPALRPQSMAPTEILAEQHWRKFGEWLAPLGVRQGYLRGGLREKGQESDARRPGARRHPRSHPGGGRVCAPGARGRG